MQYHAVLPRKYRGANLQLTHLERRLVQCLLILFNNMRLLRMLQGWQADRKQI